MPRYPAARVAALAVLPVAALTLSACGAAGSGSDASPTPRSSPSSHRPSPSAACPSPDEVVKAVDTDPAVNSGMDITAPDRIVCAGGYATTTVRSAQTDAAVVILRYRNGAWHTVVLGTDICAPDADGSRPKELVGVPDKVLDAAGCRPGYYTD